MTKPVKRSSKSKEFLKAESPKNDSPLIKEVQAKANLKFKPTNIDLHNKG